MKPILYLILVFVAVQSCSPRIATSINNKQPPLADTAFILVLQVEDDFVNDGIEIGRIRTGDKGFSTNCSYYEIIETLKRDARSAGANIIRITRRRGPDEWSSCERLHATLYHVTDIRKHEQKIEWTANRKLTPADFKGKPEEDAAVNAGAKTYCGFAFATNLIRMFKQAKIYTVNTFYCTKSWMRPEQREQPALLQHEQGHFDLCEVYTRQLRKSLIEKNLTAFNYKYANTIFREIDISYTKRQDQYDRETNHGLNEEKQQQWIRVIASELKELENFAN